MKARNPLRRSVNASPDRYTGDPDSPDDQDKDALRGSARRRKVAKAPS